MEMCINSLPASHHLEEFCKAQAADTTGVTAKMNGR